MTDTVFWRVKFLFLLGFPTSRLRTWWIYLIILSVSHHQAILFLLTFVWRIIPMLSSVFICCNKTNKWIRKERAFWNSQGAMSLFRWYRFVHYQNEITWITLSTVWNAAHNDNEVHVLEPRNLTVGEKLLKLQGGIQIKLLPRCHHKN